MCLLCGHTDGGCLGLTLVLECLSLDATSLCLFGEGLLEGLAALCLVDVLDENTLVLEHVTLALHVKLVVHVFVDLLGIPVLGKETTEHTKTAHPDDGGWETCLGGTLPLTGSSVTALALGFELHAHAVARVHLHWLLDDQTILGKLADVEPCKIRL